MYLIVVIDSLSHLQYLIEIDYFDLTVNLFVKGIVKRFSRNIHLSTNMTV